MHYKIPKPYDYPQTVTNLAEAIKKKRMDLRLPKTELGRIFSVDANTIWQWEDRGKKPHPKSMKKIIDWLEYVPPLDVNETTLGGQLYIYRMKNGYSQDDISSILKINSAFIVRIEKSRKVERKHIERIKSLLKRNEAKL